MYLLSNYCTPFFSYICRMIFFILIAMAKKICPCLHCSSPEMRIIIIIIVSNVFFWLNKQSFF